MRGVVYRTRGARAVIGVTKWAVPVCTQSDFPIPILRVTAMTFTEAALEVLRSAGEPLHYKKITEIAIEKNLLSHVGKTPEVTMSSRLATMVKKDRGSAPIIKVKPGVFAIREDLRENPEALDAALEQLAASTPDSGDETNGSVVKDKDRPSLPGADVFPEEEDDDDPILAGLDDDDGDGGEDKGRRRRRRRRRGKGDGEGEADEMPTREGRAGRETRNGRGRDRGRSRRDEPSAELELDREPGDGDLLGKGLADAVWSVLIRSERGGVTFARAAELLVRRGRMSGQGSALAPTIAAALRADVAASERAEEPRRFLLRNGRVALTDWLLPKELARTGEATVRSAEKQREQARRAWLAKVNELPLAGFAELVATWLNAQGVSSLRAVRRPASGGQELHFAGTEKRGPVETRLAVVVLRGGREIDRETVIRVRGSLHHYGNAAAAWIVTAGRTSSGAREEVAATPAVPVALFDGGQLASSMEACGIGLRARRVVVSEIDFELLEALGGDIGLRDARREREDDRARDEGDGEESAREGRRRRGRGRDRGRDEDGGRPEDQTSDEGAPDDAPERADDEVDAEPKETEPAGDAKDAKDAKDSTKDPAEATEAPVRSRLRRRRRRGGKERGEPADAPAEADDGSAQEATAGDDPNGDEDEVSTDVVDMSRHLQADEAAAESDEHAAAQPEGGKLAVAEQSLEDGADASSASDHDKDGNRGDVDDSMAAAAPPAGGDDREDPSGIE